MNTSTFDIFMAAQDCPILRGQPRNEIGADCIECARISPDRAGLCAYMEAGGMVDVDHDLIVHWSEQEEQEELK